ncbi:unnamed protein product [Peniophora sp. CBMAI 1063]|nr:unnamed protein product [Peniophora sp. CBMAI 1063]
MDPTYPLVPVANLLAAFLTFLTFLTTPLRDSWNFGVCMLSVWVSLSCFFTGIQAVIWRDNADTTILPVFCDIATRIQVGTLAGMPGCTLIITRCLHDIVRCRTVAFNDSDKRRRELVFDFFLVIGLPIVLQFFYYVVQNARYQVVEQLGCNMAILPSGMAILLLNSFPLVLSLISAVFYMSRILYFLWKHKRNMGHLFGRQIAIKRSVYLRIFALGMINFLTSITASIVNFFPFPMPVFYPGWAAVHADWTPVSISAAEWHSQGPLIVFTNVWDVWINAWLGFAIFGLFGLTREARQTYVRAFRIATRWTGRPRTRGSELTILRLPSTHPNRSMEQADLKRQASTASTLVTPASAPGRLQAFTIEISVTVERHMDLDEESAASTLHGPDSYKMEGDDQEGIAMA